MSLPTSWTDFEVNSIFTNGFHIDFQAIWTRVLRFVRFKHVLFYEREFSLQVTKSTSDFRLIRCYRNYIYLFDCIPRVGYAELSTNLIYMAVNVVASRLSRKLPERFLIGLSGKFAIFIEIFCNRGRWRCTFLMCLNWRRVRCRNTNDDYRYKVSLKTDFFF